MYKLTMKFILSAIIYILFALVLVFGLELYAKEYNPELMQALSMSGIMLYICLLLLTNVFFFRLYIDYISYKKDKHNQEIIQDFISPMEADPLTKVYSRDTTIKKIHKYLHYTHKVQKSALFLIDLDNFSEINEKFGDDFGDYLLKEIAQKIKSTFTENDIVGRVDGNLFAVLVCDIKTEEDVTKQAENLLNRLKIFTVEKSGVALSASIGIAISQMHGTTYHKLAEKADAALFSVKLKGKKAYCIYTKEIKSSPEERKQSHIVKQSHSPSDLENIHSVLISLMAKGKDFTGTIYETLAVLANYFDLDRCNIYEFESLASAVQVEHAHQTEPHIVLEQEGMPEEVYNEPQEQPQTDLQESNVQFDSYSESQAPLHDNTTEQVIQQSAEPLQEHSSSRPTKILSCTAEYAKDGINSIYSEIQSIYGEGLEEQLNELKKDGVKVYSLEQEMSEDQLAFFYHQNIKTALCSYFSYVDFTGKKTEGFILFGDCEKARRWNIHQRDVINAVSNLYSLKAAIAK